MDLSVFKGKPKLGSCTVIVVDFVKKVAMCAIKVGHGEQLTEEQLKTLEDAQDLVNSSYIEKSIKYLEAK